jgi:ABC-type transport system involved in multi-copper enzyme maturation permease subunit
MTAPTANLSRRRRIGRWRPLTDNPVFIKEIRGRMRGARAFVVLTFYLALLGAFTGLMYLAVAESAMSVSGQTNVGEIGRTLFVSIVAIEMLLVSFIAPAFTAGAISGEREHQTFDLLRTTLLGPASFVLGKLLSSMLYVLLLLLAAVPLQSIAFFFGGVAETEVILSFVILIVTALLFSTVGVFYSARSHRTLSASVLTYASVAFFTFGLPIMVGAVLLMFGFSFNNVQSSTPQIALLYLLGALICTNPAATALMTQWVLLNQQTIGAFTYTLAGGETITLISPWIPFTALYLTLTLIFFVLAVRRVRTIEN